jgi:hypothetical protein
MAGEIHDSAAWSARVKSDPLTKGLEQATEDRASRAWTLEKPRGWSGKDFVHAVQFRTVNLLTYQGHSLDPQRSEALSRWLCRR